VRGHELDLHALARLGKAAAVVRAHLAERVDEERIR
jgi:hypothetical protein